MVKVIKKNKKTEAFSSAKLAKTCKKAGCPEPIAKAIAQIIAKKVKGRKTITSAAIKKMVFDIITKLSKVPASWKKYEAAKAKKKKK